MSKHSVLRLTTINNHTTFKTGSTVVLPSANAGTFSFENANITFLKIKLKNLISALSYLSLRVEHKAATENVKIFVVKDSAVALAALNNLLRSILDSLPENRVGQNPSLNNFFNWFVAHSSNHVHIVSKTSKCCAFSWLGSPPLTLILSADFNSKTLALLHSLYVRLQTASKLLN
jgi:hypothetical protein